MTVVVAVEDRDAMNGGIHGLRDLEKLLFHHLIADRLAQDPQRVLGIARANLDRWTSNEPDTKPYYGEWRDLLASRSVTELIALITADDEEGRRLRQSTPFVGVVTPEERERTFAVARQQWDARSSEGGQSDSR
jgi:hypothetical protein